MVAAVRSADTLASNYRLEASLNQIVAAQLLVGTGEIGMITASSIIKYKNVRTVIESGFIIVNVFYNEFCFGNQDMLDGLI